MVGVGGSELPTTTSELVGMRGTSARTRRLMIVTKFKIGGNTLK
jgi:hypothetical protein